MCWNLFALKVLLEIEFKGEYDSLLELILDVICLVMDRAVVKTLSLTDLLLDFLVVAEGVLEGIVLLLDKRSTVSNEGTYKIYFRIIVLPFRFHQLMVFLPVNL